MSTDEMLEDDEIVIRPELMAFAVAMERVMRARDSERGDSYKTMDAGDFLGALLTIHKRAVHIDEEMGPDGYPARIPNLAARIGCYAMFFHYGFRNDHPLAEVESADGNMGDAPD